jgi:multiple antibiotic resistance protein
MLTGFCLAAGFLLIGKFLFKVLGISIGDFLVAGGVILFCIAIADIINPIKKRRLPGKELGAVPLGTPLIVGPAVLTTSMITLSQYGLPATFFAVVVNILCAGLVFYLSTSLIRLLGDAGTKALSKVTSLLLAAIAVMMVRRGIVLLAGLITS